MGLVADSANSGLFYTILPMYHLTPMIVIGPSLYRSSNLVSELKMWENKKIESNLPVCIGLRTGDDFSTFDGRCFWLLILVILKKKNL